MLLLSYYLVKKNFIRLKDFRNFDVLLLLTIHFGENLDLIWRKLGFGVKRWLLWSMIETIYEKGSRYFPRQYLFTGK